MIERDDHHLRQRFEALRREDAAATPPFRTTVAAARARPAAAPGRRALWLAALAPPRPQPRPPPRQACAGEVVAPTRMADVLAT